MLIIMQHSTEHKHRTGNTVNTAVSTLSFLAVRKAAVTRVAEIMTITSDFVKEVSKYHVSMNYGKTE